MSSGHSRVVFLLGSGISFPAKLPSMNKITEHILLGENIHRHSDGSYLLKPAPPGFSTENISEIQSFLKILKKEITKYYLYPLSPLSETYPENGVALEPDINYEDIYCLVTQLHDVLTGEFDNPAVKPCMDSILKETGELIGNDSFQVEDFFREVKWYVYDTTWQMLSKQPERLDYLDCIIDLYKDKRISSVSFFTLNHDTVLEEYLYKYDIDFTDGFGEPEGEPEHEVRYWDEGYFQSDTSKVNLYKLHGSVNWYRLRSDEGDWSDESIGIFKCWDIEHTKDRQGRLQRPIDGRPMILIGTFNKMLEYLRGIFMFLYTQFYESLKKTDRLVICGYGFGDKGINTRLVDWFYNPKVENPKIVVVDIKEEEELKQGARGAISNKWDMWKAEGKLSYLRKGVERITWEEIADALF